MKEVRSLKFDLERALVKGGEAENLSSTSEDRVGKDRDPLPRSSGSGLRILHGARGVYRVLRAQAGRSGSRVVALRWSLLPVLGGVATAWGLL
ncbi:hypothetical protein B296_00029595 [Ensete ventricosum]|uniref:Uncharacterized protein n=1 Tax=Ensete ventricosum TaxID=4639 RepID=A0A426YM77_ENSVE|nr:hypothetical protein B296_00029595 [Ensete ventricosum]